MQQDFWDVTRDAVMGRDASIATPFGVRRLTYADHTASGRAVRFVEDAIASVLPLYGNTHTEDDASGSVTSARLRAAEATIKRLVNAGPEHKLVGVGAGTTGAVHLLQQILGIAIPPAGKALFDTMVRGALGPARFEELSAELSARRPVVFVGPYEHHSNEISWRECFAEVVEVELTPDGRLDLADLRRKLALPAFAGRTLIGAFSAASNVSGVKTPVYEVARILHAAGALAFFDFAASAPYEPIDMRHDADSFFDAAYFSPHKFLGGPGSCGVLLFHERVYRGDLPPTVGAGGTVDFVGFNGQSYSSDIEVRETPGTPAILQCLRAALAMELKERLDPARIAAREKELVRRAHALLSSHPGVQLMGDVGADERLPIFSLNIRVGASWLHPRYVATLLNDLFGIQSRAGCSCAAPYGHRILHIDAHTSEELRRSIACGNIGLKPGWTRITFHYLLTDEEVDFLCKAVLFVAEHGKRFLPLYRFAMHDGSWRHRDAPAAEAAFGLDAGLRPSAPCAEVPLRPGLLSGYLAEAGRMAETLGTGWSDATLKRTEGDLIPFVFVQKA